jgi:hypothetical protein
VLAMIPVHIEFQIVFREFPPYALDCSQFDPVKEAFVCVLLVCPSCFPRRSVSRENRILWNSVSALLLQWVVLSHGGYLVVDPILAPGADTQCELAFPVVSLYHTMPAGKVSLLIRRPLVSERILELCTLVIRIY